jgi:hypothetical protein
MLKKILASFIITLVLFQSAYAFFGTRPMGMGGAFTAVCNDVNAAYWNPAGLALNPEVAIGASTMLNNRNKWIGDNVGMLKFCYEAAMNPFEWIIGIGAASAVAFESAKYLKNQGVIQQNWGRPGEAPTQGQAITTNVSGTEKSVSLKQELKDTFKNLGDKISETAKETAKEVVKHADVTINIGLMPYASPWYHPNYAQPNYWEKQKDDNQTEAQFALGLSWLNDNNPPLDQKSNWYTLSLASGFEERIAVGMGINFYDMTKISTNIRGMGADLDLGVVAKPVEYISLGLVTKSVLTTDFNWQSGEKTRGYAMSVNAGLAINPVPALTLAADAHNIFNQNNSQATTHFGAEAVLMSGILGRVGLDNNNKTAGLSIALGNLMVDYAILGGSYCRTQTIGASWRF